MRLGAAGQTVPQHFDRIPKFRLGLRPELKFAVALISIKIG
jgi:hypothetical protein